MNTVFSKPGYKYFSCLSCIYLTILLTANIFAYKILYIHNHLISLSSLIFPLSFAITTIIAQVYGPNNCKRLIQSAFFCCLLFSTAVSCFINIPSDNWQQHLAFVRVFDHNFRFSVAGAIGSWVGHAINIRVLQHFPKIMLLPSLPLRFLLANTLGELALVLITTPFAFYHTVASQSLLSIMTSSYLSKVVFSLVLANPSIWCIAYLKQIELH